MHGKPVLLILNGLMWPLSFSYVQLYMPVDCRSFLKMPLLWLGFGELMQCVPSVADPGGNPAMVPLDPVWLWTLAPSNEEIYLRYWETFKLSPPSRISVLMWPTLAEFLDPPVCTIVHTFFGLASYNDIASWCSALDTNAREVNTKGLQLIAAGSCFLDVLYQLHTRNSLKCYLGKAA